MVTTDLVVNAVDVIADHEEADAVRSGAMLVDGNFPDPLLDKSVDSDANVEEETGVDDGREDIDSETEPVELRRSERIKLGVAHPERYTLVTKISEAQWCKQEETGKAITSELKQLFHEELNALMPVKNYRLALLHSDHICL